MGSSQKQWSSVVGWLLGSVRQCWAVWAVGEIGISDVLDTFSDDGKWVVVC